MATKRINELSLRTDFDATCNLPVDDSIQSFRVTGTQILNFIAANLTRALLPAGVIAKLKIVSKTANYTIGADDDVILCDSSGGTFTLTLPAISGIAGRVITVKKTDSSAVEVVVDANGSETIDGAADVRLYNQYESVRLVATSSEWSII